VALTRVRGAGIDADGQEIILDADGDTSIEASADDTIVIDTSGSERVRIDSNGALQIGGTTDAGFIDFDGQSLQLNTQRNPNTGTFVNTGKSHASIALRGADGGSEIRFATQGSNNSVSTERARINTSGQTNFFNGIAFKALVSFNLTTSYQDIVGIGSTSGNDGRGFILAVSSENNYHQHWNIQVSQSDLSVHYFGGDSGHTHSKDVQWQKSGNHIQAKKTLSTGRPLTVYMAVGAVSTDFV